MNRTSRPEPLTVDRVDSPIGAILVVHDGQGQLRALDFEDHAPRMRQLLRLYHGAEGIGHTLRDGPAPHATRHALERYFAGDLTAVDGLGIMTGGTEFQRAVWTALRRIRPGTTTTYGALARQVGRPRAMRAVGAANGANPISIVLPCHRVIGADASLTGYGGGLDRKRWLLTHEGAMAGAGSVADRAGQAAARAAAPVMRDNA